MKNEFDGEFDTKLGLYLLHPSLTLFMACIKALDEFMSLWLVKTVNILPCTWRLHIVWHMLWQYVMFYTTTGQKLQE